MEKNEDYSFNKKSPLTEKVYFSHKSWEHADYGRKKLTPKRPSQELIEQTLQIWIY